MSNYNFLLLADANSPQNALLDSFYSSGLSVPPEEVRGDANIAVSITPVVTDPTGQFLYQYDSLSTDIYRLGIGTPDATPTSGAAIFSLNGHAFTLNWNDSAGAATTALQAASTAGSYGTVTVLLLQTGVYQATWTNLATVPAITETSNSFNPTSNSVISRIVPGDASNPAQQIIRFVQQLVVYAEPSTQLTAASLTNSTTQAPTATLNAIRKITFNAAGTYGGTFSVTVLAGGSSESVGIANPQMTADEFALLLSNHSAVHFQDPNVTDNISVIKTAGNFLTEFLGTLGGPATVRTINAATVANPSVITTSAAHGYATGDSVVISGSTGTTPSLNGTYTITVLSTTTFSIPLNVTVSSGASASVYNASEGNTTATNIDLMAPKGVSGFVNFNTVNLWKQFALTAEDSLNFTLSVERERVSGEVKTLLLISITLLRDLIDVTSLVVLQKPGVIYSGNEFRVLAITHGGKIQVSNDNGATWEDGPSFVHS